MDRTAMEFRGQVDAVILTIREDETDAIKARLNKLEPTQGRLRYHIAQLRSATRALTLALHRIREPGTGPAQLAATAAIEDLDPRLLVLVGIAGAVPAAEFCLGDVIIATRIADLRVQALLPEFKTELSVRSDRVHAGLVDLLTNLSKVPGWSSAESIAIAQPAVPLTRDRFTGDSAWKKKVRKALEDRFSGAQLREPKCFIGEIGSQDSLVKDPAILTEWLRAVRKVEAVEMEAAGVMEAAARTDGLYPVLVVRGISDLVGYKRDVAWNTYACNTAAAFTVGLLASGQLDSIGPFRTLTSTFSRTLKYIEPELAQPARMHISTTQEAPDNQSSVVQTKSIPNEIRAELLKKQSDELEAVLSLFSHGNEIELRQQAGLYELFDINLRRMLDDYARFRLGLAQTKEGESLAKNNSPLHVRVHMDGLGILWSTDEVYSKDQGVHPSLKPLPWATDWSLYRCWAVHIPAQLNSLIEKLEQHAKSPFMPEGYASRVDAIAAALNDNVSAIMSTFTDCAQELAVKYPTPLTFSKASFAWIANKYNEQCIHLQPLLDELRLYMRSYFQV